MPPVLGIDERVVLVVMLEVTLLNQRRFVQVIIGRNAVFACNLGQLLYILHVIAAYVDVEEYGIAVFVLLANQVIEMLTHRSERLRQPGLLVDSVDGKIEDGNPGIRQTVDYIRTQ